MAELGADARSPIFRHAALASPCAVGFSDVRHVGAAGAATITRERGVLGAPCGDKA